ncbi:uncharacterized protein LOC62_01G001514 [Vanrija pseudolonga]|uniref:Uncharacterized protein n=1 Tax=Vanrija pseudolonga TaxID=143232 RepID=A0AAF0Y574_9TREE|nr:hypothetical protein LOC62_01G001514 [Vanrija pseudolonga]
MNPYTPPTIPAHAGSRRQPRDSHPTGTPGAGDAEEYVSVDHPTHPATSRMSGGGPLNPRLLGQPLQARRDTPSRGTSSSAHAYPPPASPAASPDRLPGSYPPAPAEPPFTPGTSPRPSSAGKQGWRGLPGSWGARLSGLPGVRDTTPTTPTRVRQPTPATPSPSALLGKFAQLASPSNSWGLSKGRRSDSVTASHQASEVGESSTGRRPQSPPRPPRDVLASTPHPKAPPSLTRREGAVEAHRGRGYASCKDTEAWGASLAHLATMGSTARWATSAVPQEGDDDGDQARPPHGSTTAHQTPEPAFEGPTHPTFTLDRDGAGNFTFGVARADDEVASIPDSEPDAHDVYGVDSIHSADSVAVQREGISEGWEAVADEVAEEAAVDDEWVGGASAVVSARRRAERSMHRGGSEGAKEGSRKSGWGAGASGGRTSGRRG